MKICPVRLPRHAAGSSITIPDRRLAPSPCVHRSGWIIGDPWHIYKDGYVFIENGRICAIGQGPGPKGAAVVDHGPGVLSPILVNAHTHLELGALKNKIPYNNGFRYWVTTLLQKRAELSKTDITAGILRGQDELEQSGCFLIGEISSLGYSRETLMGSNLSGICFQELLGNPPERLPECSASNGMLREALAAHAPHTSAPDLLRAIKQATRARGMPMSIHVSESSDEIEFITTAKGAWADFLSQRGIDFSHWNLPAVSPVHRLDQLGILDKKTIAVHLLHARQKEFDLLSERGVTVCVCPRSNFNLHGRLPDISTMLSAGLSLCFGTDSPASVSSLSIWDEMKLVATYYPSVSPQDILAMATVNGAEALGFSDTFGSLKQGMLPAMVYVSISASSPSALLENIVYGDD